MLAGEEKKEEEEDRRDEDSLVLPFPFLFALAAIIPDGKMR